MRLHLEKYTGKSMTVRNYEYFYLARAYLGLPYDFQQARH